MCLPYSLPANLLPFPSNSPVASRQACLPARHSICHPNDNDKRQTNAPLYSPASKQNKKKRARGRSLWRKPNQPPVPPLFKATPQASSFSFGVALAPSQSWNMSRQGQGRACVRVYAYGVDVEGLLFQCDGPRQVRIKKEPGSAFDISSFMFRRNRPPAHPAPGSHPHPSLNSTSPRPRTQPGRRH